MARAPFTPWVSFSSLLFSFFIFQRKGTPNSVLSRPSHFYITRNVSISQHISLQQLKQKGHTSKSLLNVVSSKHRKIRAEVKDKGLQLPLINSFIIRLFCSYVTQTMEKIAMQFCTDIQSSHRMNQEFPQGFYLSSLSHLTDFVFSQVFSQVKSADRKACSRLNWFIKTWWCCCSWPCK